jgi:ubiquinone biosynthesis protein
LALISSDAEDLVSGIFALGATSPNTNRDKLTEDAEQYLSKYAGTTGISDVDMSDVFTEVTDLASKHHIKLPGQFTMLGRAALAIYSVSKLTKK